MAQARAALDQAEGILAEELRRGDPRRIHRARRVHVDALGRTGDVDAALAAYEPLVADTVALFGERSVETLTVRAERAALMTTAGEPRTWSTFGLLARREAGSFDRLYDRCFPSRFADGAIAFGPNDGRVSGPITVEGALWRSAPIADLRFPLPTQWRLFSVTGGLRKRRTVSLYVTDSRLVLAVNNPPSAEHPDDLLLGHIRYPWITGVSFRPKQRWLYDCELVIGMQQAMEAEPREHREFQLELMLDEGVDSGALARDIAQRLARHRLTFDDLPPRAREAFEAMSHCERLADPARGDHSTYWTQAFMPYPYGSDEAGDGDILGSWWMGPAV